METCRRVQKLHGNQDFTEKDGANRIRRKIRQQKNQIWLHALHTPCHFSLTPTAYSTPTDVSLLYADALAAVPIISQRLGPPTACLHLLH